MGDVGRPRCAEWLAAEASPAVADYLYEPMLQGFYFQLLEGNSRALAMAVAAFGFHRPKTMTVEGGIGRIPDALAARLDVRPDSPVVRLEIGAQGVSVGTPAGELEAEHAIVAAPAHVARELLGAEATPAEAELLACTYSATINVCLGLSERFRLPHVLGDVYGFLIPARERRYVAAVSIERNKSPDRARRGELLEVFLSGDAADRLLGDSDGDVLAAVIPELERYLPGVGGRRDDDTSHPVARRRAALPGRACPCRVRLPPCAAPRPARPARRRLPRTPVDRRRGGRRWAAAALVKHLSAARRAANEPRPAS